MKTNVFALLSGTLFGLGLAISQMINPAKVLAFLDVAGHWDPSLALVMASALAVMALAWRWQRRQPAALSGDFRLQGLVGYCPGPAIASLALLSLKPLIFVAAMIAGMALFQVFPSGTRD